MTMAYTVPTTLVSGDPRWIGCWWLGYLLVSVGILVTSVPLWFFPASMTGHRQRRRSLMNEVSVTVHDSDRRKILRSIWREIRG